MSLSVGKGVLIDAKQEFLREWSRVRESWRDGNAEAFERAYVAPIEGHVRRAVAAMDELTAVVAAAQRECS
jgi:hypothetical protein